MKRMLVPLLVVALQIAAHGQALREINFSHWYNQDKAFSMQIRPFRLDQWACYYELKLIDTTRRVDDFSIEWQLRNSLGEKEGKIITDSTYQGQAGARAGKLIVPLSPEMQYLVAKVTDRNLTRNYFFYVMLEPKYPETFLFMENGKVATHRYVNKTSTLAIDDAGKFHVSHYDDTFPTAPLAFSEALGKVSRKMQVDSTFVSNGKESFALITPGLYIVQKDTTSAEGIAFRVENDYPRYSKLKNVADPLVYICSSQEYERIKLANGEKKAFDKVILSITKDTDRAKKLMRSYFKRVEGANQFFTSYKEGWKTDRGMIFIIFGPPDEVYRTGDHEVWNYKSNSYKANFDFVRSPSIFDPHNYVLVRDKKYTDLWYEVVDLWRNARF